MAFSRLAMSLKIQKSIQRPAIVLSGFRYGVTASRPRLLHQGTASRCTLRNTTSRPFCQPSKPPAHTKFPLHSQFRSMTQVSPPTSSRLRRILDMTLGALLLTSLVTAGTLYYVSSGHVLIEKVPLTNRRRMLWVDKKYDEELGHPIEDWLMVQRQKPRLSEDDPIAVMVRGIMERLKSVELAKGLDFKLYMFDDFAEPNAWGGPAQHGGRIFINTGCIQGCKSPDEVAAVLAHEMGHVIARHTIELSVSKAFAQHLVRYFGYRGDIGTDLISLRVQEAEADHMGLLIMAEAGFNPEARMEYLKDRLEEETKWLAGREPLPEFLSTHPSSDHRIELAEKVLPAALARYKEKGAVKPEKENWNWTEVKTNLDAAYKEYNDLVAQDETLQPQRLLAAIDSKLNALIEVWNTLVEVQKSAVEEALKSKVLEDAVKEVVAQKEEMAKVKLTADSKAHMDEGIADMDDESTDGRDDEEEIVSLVRQTDGIALAPPPRISQTTASMATGPEGSCVIPQPETVAVAGENAKADRERSESSSSKDS